MLVPSLPGPHTHASFYRLLFSESLCLSLRCSVLTFHAYSSCPSRHLSTKPPIHPSKSEHSLLNFPLTFSQRRRWHPTPVLLPGKSHGRRSLVGCSPWGHKESDALEKEMAAHSSVLAWRIPGTGEPGRLPSMGSHRVGHN